MAYSRRENGNFFEKFYPSQEVLDPFSRSIRLFLEKPFFPLSIKIPFSNMPSPQQQNVIQTIEAMSLPQSYLNVDTSNKNLSPNPDPQQETPLQTYSANLFPKSHPKGF